MDIVTTEPRPMTVEELKPFFSPEGQLHLENALLRFHLASTKEQLAEAMADKPDPGLEGAELEAASANGSLD